VATENVSIFMLRRLRNWGVRRVFAYPGDGSNGLDLAFRDGPELEFVQPRHEEIAAFAATAHAKLTGEVGVCLATSGPGAIHLLNGLYDARLDHAPVRRHRRPAGADVARRELSAGGRPALRCSRTSPASTCRPAATRARPAT
jgi:glyoxylate carboligase